MELSIYENISLSLLEERLTLDAVDILTDTEKAKKQKITLRRLIKLLKKEFALGDSSTREEVCRCYNALLKEAERANTNP